MSFKREERYTVIKHKDITAEDKIELDRFLKDLGIETKEAVVVEEDWPEYELVWYMIEKRMEGKELVDILEDLFISHKILKEEAEARTGVEVTYLPEQY